MEAVSYSAYQNMDEEQLKQILENLEKDNDTLSRENKLYESYIERNKDSEPDLRQLEETEVKEEKKGKRGKKVQQQVKQKKTLTLQEKYDIATQELEDLKKEIQKGQKDSEELLDMLKAILNEIDMNIAEIKREAHEFKRDIVLGSENSRTGNIVAEKLIKYIEDKLKQKDSAIAKYKSQNEQLEKKIRKERQKIAKKEKASDDLQFIDFHQLQIENKKLVRDIDERNKELITLKLTSGRCTLRLTNVKTTLQKEEKELEQLKHEIVEFKKQIEKNEEDIKKVTDTSKRLGGDLRNLRLQKSQADNLPSVTDYINLKDQESTFSKQVKTLERKIEIAQPNYYKALKLLKRQTVELS